MILNKNRVFVQKPNNLHAAHTTFQAAYLFFILKTVFCFRFLQMHTWMKKYYDVKVDKIIHRRVLGRVMTFIYQKSIFAPIMYQNFGFTYLKLSS